MSEKLKHKELTEQIIGCCMEVHNELGPGFLEPVYEEALMHEFENQNVDCKNQVELNIFYKNKKLNKKYIADIIIGDMILMEIKAVKKLSNIDKAQIINYLKTTKINLGLLINFGEKSLTWQRVVY